MATAFPSTEEYVSALSKSGLVAREDLARVEAFLRESARRGPRQLADFLVREGLLTRFQASFLMEGRLADLKLAGYTLLEVLGAGAMGTVYKARWAKDQGLYALRIVPRRHTANLNAIAEKVQALKQV